MIKTFQEEIIEYQKILFYESKDVDYENLIKENIDINPVLAFKLKQKFTGNISNDYYLKILKKYPIQVITDKSILRGIIELYPYNEEYIEYFISVLSFEHDLTSYFANANWLIETISSKKGLLQLVNQVINIIKTDYEFFLEANCVSTIDSFRIKINNLKKICKKASITYEQIFSLLKDPHYSDKNRQSVYQFIKEHYHLNQQKFDSILSLYSIKEG